MNSSNPATSKRPAEVDAALHSGMTNITRLPDGAVTFLYTDIEGSTERWERAPVEMREALSRHHAILRSAIEAQQGVVYQIIGDAFVAIFAAAPAALHTALAAQRALLAESWQAAVAPLQVRMGLHHGQGRYQDDGYHAEESLNRLFRLLSASYGGQIVLTDDVYNLIGEAWPPEVSARNLGQHRLRDLTTQLHVWQVVAPYLPSDFPALRSLSHHPNNLPSQTTELYGRTEEIAVVASRLRTPGTRQLTLTGLGGIGKTRLGLAVAAELLPDFPDGVYLVALDQVQVADQVATTLAATLGIRDTGEQPLPQLLAQWLQPKRLLLLLDNCEHVLAGMPLIADLLGAAPHLKVLATSRVPLGVYGEREHAVPPLPLPSADTITDLATLGRNAAIQLFVTRAQAVSSGFTLSTVNAAAVTEICLRLEGLPLAIELAAARVRGLPPTQILARLSDRLDFLTAQSRDGPLRQQTLRATLEWSYALLPPLEQQLLAWLSVFVGGASLEAISMVWNSDAEPPLDVIDGLIALVSHSLVQAQLDDEMPRYVLLETVREYGREQLALRAETPGVTMRHAAYFQQLAATYGMSVIRDSNARAVIAQDYPNLRVALHGALDRGDVAIALNIGAHLAYFWSASGSVREGWQLMQAVLALPLPDDPSRDLQLQQARAEHRAVMLAEEVGEHLQARRLVEAALATARVLEDDVLLALALATLSDFLDPVTDYEQILAMLNESLIVNQRLESPNQAAVIYIKLGVIENARGAFAVARSYFEQSLPLFRRATNRRGVIAALNNLGDLFIAQQEYATAKPYFMEALAFGYELDYQPTIIKNLVGLSRIALHHSDMPTAQMYLSEALQRADVGGYIVLSVFTVGYIGWFAYADEQVEDAANLLGAYDALAPAHQRGQSILTDHEQAPLLAARDQARLLLGEETFERHYTAGQQMPLPEAIAAAREVVGSWSDG